MPRGVFRQAAVGGMFDDIKADGQCGVHTYPNVSANVVNTILRKLQAQGMSAESPSLNVWDFDTDSHGVKLRATWNPSAQTLSVIVTDSSLLATCDKIWAKIDPLLNQIIQGG